jgi:hypothetical protein
MNNIENNYGIIKEEKSVNNMTVEDALIVIATNRPENVAVVSKIYLAKNILEESDITCSVDKYTLKINCEDVTYTVVKNDNSGDYYCSLDCEFVYKRSVEGRMLPVGVRDKNIGTVVLMYMDFDKKTEGNYQPGLFYPEFYIYVGEKERKSINYSTYNWFYPPNYYQVEAKSIEFLKEIVVNGEGKNEYVIGFTAPTSDDEDKVYLYKTKVLE